MVNRAKGLTGLNPLAYLGVEAVAPTAFIALDRDPTPADWENFNLGTVWLNTSALSVFFLARIYARVATWIPLGMAGGDVQTITGNDAVVISPDGAGNINIVTANSSVQFTGAANTLTQDFGITNLLLGSSGSALAGGQFNVALGDNALQSVTTGNDNLALGADALLNVTTGSFNIALGSNVGNVLTTESNNIFIGAVANIGDNGTIRIGVPGVHTSTFIAGISGVVVANQNVVTINTATGQLGSVAMGLPVTGTGTTVGPVATNIIVMPAGAVAGIYSIVARVAGFEATTPAGTAYQLTAGVRTNGALATIMGTTDQIINEDPILVNTDAQITTVGNNIVVLVSGVVGLTINWKAELEFTFAP